MKLEFNPSWAGSGYAGHALDILKTAHEALQKGDFETAFETLEKGARTSRDPRIAALCDLEMAGMYTLYGREGVEGSSQSLSNAVMSDPKLRQDPTYMALRAANIAFTLELEASELGERISDAEPRKMRALELAAQSRGGSSLAKFHAVSALVTLGEPETALEILELIVIEELPEFLRWRYWSWRGGALEGMSRWREAEQAYNHGADLTAGTDRAALLMDQAAMLLELEEPFEALSTLEQVAALYNNLEPALEAASRLHLEARAHLALDNPGLARERAELARALEDEVGEPSFGVALVHGQSLAAMADMPGALAAFSRAVQLAPAADKSYALHEMGLAQMDAGLPEESRSSLNAALLDSEYPYKGEVLADLAELEYRLGDFDATERQATLALEAGAIIPASLLLANIAYEYYRLDDALEHYNRVLEFAPETSRDWVLAHQMIADTLVQLGWRDPIRILYHAQIALPHLEPSDEWAVTLEGYIQKANGLLGSSAGRTLN